MWRQADAAGLTVFGLGVGVPGLVDFDGVLHRAPNLLEWQGIAPAEVVADMLGRPLQSLYCDNEANLAALGELWFGIRNSLRDFVFVSVRSGSAPGSSSMANCFRGVQGLGGELGPRDGGSDGPACKCGGRGCLERVAAGGLARSRRVACRGVPRSQPCRVRARARGASAGRRADDALLTGKGRTALGIALSAFLNVLDLPAVVLGGFYAELAPWLIGPVTSELHDRVVNHSWSPTEVVVSSLGASIRPGRGRHHDTTDHRRPFCLVPGNPGQGLI